MKSEYSTKTFLPYLRIKNQKIQFKKFAHELSSDQSAL